MSRPAALPPAALRRSSASCLPPRLCRQRLLHRKRGAPLGRRRRQLLRRLQARGRRIRQVQLLLVSVCFPRRQGRGRARDSAAARCMCACGSCRRAFARARRGCGAGPGGLGDGGPLLGLRRGRLLCCGHLRGECRCRLKRSQRAAGCLKRPVAGHAAPHCKHESIDCLKSTHLKPYQKAGVSLCRAEWLHCQRCVMLNLKAVSMQWARHAQAPLGHNGCRQRRNQSGSAPAPWRARPAGARPPRRPPPPPARPAPGGRPRRPPRSATRPAARARGAPPRPPRPCPRAAPPRPPRSPPAPARALSSSTWLGTLRQ